MAFKADITPQKLIIISIVIIYFIYHSISIYKIFSKKKFWTWVILRWLVILFIVLSFLNITIVKNSNKTTTIFLIDKSLSMEGKQQISEDYINTQLKKKNRNDKVSVISFGKDTMIELPITEDVEEITLASNIDNQFTNVEKALNYSRRYFPKDTNKRLVILTDGKENLGDTKNELFKLNKENINTYIYPVKAEIPKDAQISDIHIPDKIYLGENIPVDIYIDSNFSGNGRCYLYKDDIKVSEIPIAVKEGTNEINIPLIFKDKKDIDIKAEIEVEGDFNSKNNIFNKRICQTDYPKILLVGMDKDKKNIEELLNSISVEYESYQPQEITGELEFVSKFDAVILSNLPHDKLTKEFEQNLNIAIKDKGIGLIVTGGEESFALGGYEDTLLENMLPVKSRMQGDKKHPNTGLVLIIDASGSMKDESGGVKKIEMAKEAAIRSVEILEEKDYLGVLAFSDELEWIVPYGQVKNKEVIKEQVGKMASKGGTLIKPALYQGLEQLKSSEVKTKHIILLTDGQGEKKGYEKLIKKANDEGITISTVALGKDSDSKLLKSLSEDVFGRFYHVMDYSSIPKIFARETYMAKKEYVNNRSFIPSFEEKAPFINNQPVPKLNGYMGTGLKKEAHMVLKSDIDDPILSYWQYGLGNVIVWASDTNGKWSSDWISWDGFSNVFSNIINYSLSNDDREDMNVQINRDGTKLDVFVDTVKPDENQTISMIVNGPDQFRKEISLNQYMLGKFKHSFYLERQGFHQIIFRYIKNNNLVSTVTRGVYLDYSPEYSLSQRNCIGDIIELGDGQIISKEDNVFKLPLNKKNKSKHSMSFILLPLAILCFVLDIWVRKW